MNEKESVSCKWWRDDVAIIAIQRPERLNALNLEVKGLIEGHLERLRLHDNPACVIITGSAEVFVAGTDLAEMKDMTSDDHQRLRTGAVFDAVRSMPVPVIAAVEGYALGGGCELALACDMIVAGAGARFGQPEIKVGIMPGAGGTQILTRALGSHRAMKMVLTGEFLGAEEAYALGLISEVVEAGQALPQAQALAQTIAQMPRTSVRSIKAAIRHGQDLPLTDALRFERELFEELFGTHDQREGMAAFLEKRRAVFGGRNTEALAEPRRPNDPS